jgi:hypothetical protein
LLSMFLHILTLLLKEKSISIVPFSILSRLKQAGKARP